MKTRELIESPIRDPNALDDISNLKELFASGYDRIALNILFKGARIKIHAIGVTQPVVGAIDHIGSYIKIKDDSGDEFWVFVPNIKSIKVVSARKIVKNILAALKRNTDDIDIILWQMSLVKKVFNLVGKSNDRDVKLLIKYLESERYNE